MEADDWLRRLLRGMLGTKRKLTQIYPSMAMSKNLAKVNGLVGFCLNCDCNLLTLNGTSPCECNGRAGVWGNSWGESRWYQRFLLFLFFYTNVPFRGQRGLELSLIRHAKSRAEAVVVPSAVFFCF